MPLLGLSISNVDGHIGLYTREVYEEVKSKRVTWVEE